MLNTLRHLIKYGLLAVLLLIFFTHALVVRESEGRIFRDPGALPPVRVALVLGTSQYTRSGQPNRFFEARMDAAAVLHRNGVVRVLLVSGDNAHPSYNEPAAMTAALVERGIPETAIVQDYAGLRTLDSVVRTAEVFGAENFVIVSQEFHVERALFLAAANGIEAWGFAARDAEGMAQVSVRLREYAARVQAVLDGYVFQTEPRFLGEPLPIEFPEDSAVESGA